MNRPSQAFDQHGVIGAGDAVLSGCFMSRSNQRNLKCLRGLGRPQKMTVQRPGNDLRPDFLDGVLNGQCDNAGAAAPGFLNAGRYLLPADEWAHPVMDNHDARMLIRNRQKSLVHRILTFATAGYDLNLFVKCQG